MTTREISYELIECVATTAGITGKLHDKLDIMAMELMGERLIRLYDHFQLKYDKEIKDIDALIEKTFKE